MASASARPLRADAQRNRDRLLKVAVRAFSSGSPDVTLESIARDAGVGIGTLYRHFPTREALIEAAYRNELARLCGSAAELLQTGPADVAASLSGVSLVAGAPDQRDQAGRLLDLLLDGLRRQPPAG